MSSNWFHRILSEPVSAPAVPNRPDASSWPPPTPLTPRFRDRNAPDYRYQVNQKCIYERRLPGGSYITAHVQRLQSGYYDSPVIHEDRIDNVRFVAINFVFHPSASTFRFKSAEISVALHHAGLDDRNPLQVVAGLAAPKTSHDHGTQTETVSNSQALVRSRDCVHFPGFKPSRPKFLRHAPHLLYGSISPETLNWNFNLAGSLGVSQGPASATFNPSYGVKSSYKVYEMMKIQGSVRTLRSWYGRDYDIEDGELVWTLEENRLQKSGLPREFTFVMLLTKGSGGFEECGDVELEIDIRPKVAGRLGAAYSSLITNLHQYQPFKHEVLDLDKEIGQVFEPHVKGRGFNFANIATSFDDFVWLPGTAYSTSDAGVPQSPTGAATQQHQQAPLQQVALAQQQPQQGSQSQSHHQKQQHGHSGNQHQTPPSGDTTLNLRLILEHSRENGSPVPVAAVSHQLVQQQPPYVILNAAPRNPSRAQSPLPAASITTSGGSQRSTTRRTVTIGSPSSRSVRKRRSRTELSREYHYNDKASPTEAEEQEPRHSRERQAVPLPGFSGQRASPSPSQSRNSAPAGRPFSFHQEGGKGDDALLQDSSAAAPTRPEWNDHTPPRKKNASTSPIRPSSSPEYTTPPAYPHRPLC
ncbi:hypothetical protein AYL99_03871 [Fonsecaea erecta]|uniref:Uncharacterized protein n=1 Tax=Fonsecaea erecta TaxID=1367422 RepID=A0A178ZPB8_9EURO|nr:hypothetical protein AYL99_03871 [Fonsecaea erecta]OAP61668.1 hypothetical protein AYL99_03871 [Fonsecaea erecta]